MTIKPTDPGVAAGMAAASALLPLAGQNGQLAATLIAQGFAFWTDRLNSLAAGKLTIADLDSMAASLGTDVAKLRADIAAMPDDPA